jgi:hypothetical protein
VKKLAAYVFLVAVSLFLLDRIVSCSFDYLYRHMLTGQSGGKINYYLSLEPSPKLLIMGDSRAYRHIDPAYFPVSAYNIGHAGMDQRFQTALLHIIVARKKLPQYILLQIEPPDFIEHKGSPRKISDTPQHLKYYYRTDTMVEAYINQISFYEKWKFCFDSYRYNGALVNILKNFYQSRNVQNPGNGFEALPASELDSVHVMLTSKRTIDTMLIQFNPSQISSLNTFVEICRVNRIQLICFSSHLYTSFADNVSYSRKLGEMLSGWKIPYLNYVDEHDEDLSSPFLWQDAYHLNAKGAKIESARLSQDLMKIIHPGG